MQFNMLKRDGGGGGSNKTLSLMKSMLGHECNSTQLERGGLGEVEQEGAGGCGNKTLS